MGMSFQIGYINLMKTVLGSGTIIYPSLIYKNGLINTIFLTIMSCFFSTIGLLIYVNLNNRKFKTLSTLTNNRKMRSLIDFIIVFKCVSVSILYIVSINEIIENFCKSFNFEWQKSLSFSLLLLNIPISALKRFSKLRFTSFLGISAIIIMAVASLSRFITDTPKGNIVWRASFDWSTLGSYVFAFTCHQSIFTYQNESKANLKLINSVIIATMISAMIFYFSFGLLNAYFFDMSDSFFKSLPHDKTTQFMEFCFLVTIVFAIPLQLNAAQYYLRLEKAASRYLFVTSVFLIGVIIAFNHISLDLIFSSVGGTASCLMCFIISGIYFVTLGEKKAIKMRASAIGSILFGSTVLLVTLWQTGRKFVAIFE